MKDTKQQYLYRGVIVTEKTNEKSNIWNKSSPSTAKTRYDEQGRKTFSSR